MLLYQSAAIQLFKLAALSLVASPAATQLATAAAERITRVVSKTVLCERARGAHFVLVCFVTHQQTLRKVRVVLLSNDYLDSLRMLYVELDKERHTNTKT